MRRYIIIFMLLTAMASHAKLRYFTADSVAVPPAGEIIAVEARVAHPLTRVGEGRFAGWQIGWPGVTIALTFDNRNFVDGISNGKVMLEYGALKSQIYKNINTDGKFNSIAIEWQADGKVHILAGERKLDEYMVTDSIPSPTGIITVRPIGGGNIIIQDVIIETNDNAFARLMTDYSAEELANAPRWEYLDRATDPKTAVVGGKYVLAQIGNDLIYIAGATTNPGSWLPGMLKGRLIPTGFDGYSKLQWYDATGREMPGEHFAEHDETLGVLKLNFPELDASVRLKRADKQRR